MLEFCVKEYSLPRAQHRLKAAQEEAGLPEATVTARKQELQKFITSLTIYCSQIGDTRPLSYCSFSPDSTMLATSSWSVSETSVLPYPPMLHMFLYSLHLKLAVHHFCKTDS